ncbi:hypothetical protein K3M67_20870 (plasmid) [Sphingobium sp. V4]|uniref:hypothetical protein n=1 Tax=Sphingobium sp. V4 TaxID=3038927 RepID=UPI0025582B3A|nr:hypothetical protein [Sphingobium sp. V4]WIW90468.1 hypothetical protein K3M67_20870 [Sphingobium sp. V4]
MPEIDTRPDLKSRLARNWEMQTDRPRPVIILASPGTDHGLELQEVADDLGIQYIRLHLQQVVTPGQHGILTQDKARLVVISGVEQLTPGERDALVRLIYSGPRTLPAILCPVEGDVARKIMAAFGKLRRIGETQLCRTMLAQNGSTLSANSTVSGAVV